jgi:hypothetical protein
MQHEIAKRVLDTALLHSDLINESIRGERTRQEFEGYRKHAAQIMGCMFTNIIAPICEEHPDIAPDWYHEPVDDDDDDDEVGKEPLALSTAEIATTLRHDLLSVVKIVRSSCDPEEAARFEHGVTEIVRYIGELERFLSDADTNHVE